MRNRNSKCIILMPIKDYPEIQTDGLMIELRNRGYAVKMLYNCMYLDKSRSYLATKALSDGYDELMWIDSDMVFNPDEIEVLRAHDLPMVCGLYPMKSKTGGLASKLLGSCKTLTFGPEGGLTEIRYAATGFLYTKREVYTRIKDKFNLPICTGDDYGDIVPYFYPMIAYDGSSYSYMGEDISFCERARQCGYKIYADTTIRLAHIGKYRYSWEDIPGERPRARTFEVDFSEADSD